jgi:hypothetical protein
MQMLVKRIVLVVSLGHRDKGSQLACVLRDVLEFEQPLNHYMQRMLYV